MSTALAMKDKEMKLAQRIDLLVKSSSQSEVKSIYREWASHYDADLTEYGYIAPNRVAELLDTRLKNKQSLIYDAGCGTGRVGVLLHKKGFTRLHGGDFSPEMLAQAQNHSIYIQLDHADYTAPLDIADASYQAIVSVGVYTARFKTYFLSEMLRCLQPGGWFIFTCREMYFENEVHSSLSELLDKGKIDHLEIALEPYMLGENSKAYYITLSKALEAS